MKTTKAKRKSRTQSKPKAKPINSNLHLFDANCTARQIFDSLTGKGKQP